MFYEIVWVSEVGKWPCCWRRNLAICGETGKALPHRRQAIARPLELSLPASGKPAGYHSKHSIRSFAKTSTWGLLLLLRIKNTVHESINIIIPVQTNTPYTEFSLQHQQSGIDAIMRSAVCPSILVVLRGVVLLLVRRLGSSIVTMIGGTAGL